MDQLRRLSSTGTARPSASSASNTRPQWSIAGTATSWALPPAERLKAKVCAPAVQFSVAVKVPITAVVNDTVVLPVPPAGTAIVSGVAVNCVAVGAVQVTVVATRPGFWNATAALVGAPPMVKVGSVSVPPLTGVEVNGVADAVPDRLKVKVCVPAEQLSVPVKGPATALLNEIVVEPLPPAATGIEVGATVNCVAAGAVQVTVAATRPGFWNATGAVVAAPPKVKAGKVMVDPDAGVEVNGVAAAVPVRL